MSPNKAQKFFQSNVADYKKEHYESGHRTFMSVRQACFLSEIDAIGFEKGSKCLDAGCGPGLLSMALAQRGFQAHCVDTSEQMLNLTQGLFLDKGLSLPELKQGSIESIPYDDNTFDLVASAGVIEYLENDDAALRDFFRVLKPGGMLVLSITNRLSPVGLFEGVIEWVKRVGFTRDLCNVVLKSMGSTPVRAREFSVRKHKPSELDDSVLRNRFAIKSSGFFYMLPWPHPFDRLFPKANSKLNQKMESLSRSRLGWLSEGYYIVAQKPIA